MSTKDTWDVILNIATVLVAAVAAWKALIEFKLNRIQRKEDLRWKQSEAAKAIIDDWLDDEEAFAFCKMIEYENRNFRNEEGKEFRTDTRLIKTALCAGDEETTRTKRKINERYVRDSCDSFLFYTEMMNQGLECNLYLLENLLFPLSYYLKRMKEKGIYDTVITYASENEYEGSLRLFKVIIR